MPKTGRGYYLHTDLIVEYKKNSPRSFAWESHFHPGCELYFIHKGEGQILLDDRFYSLYPGCLVVINSLRLHYITPQSPSSFVRTVIHFLPSWLHRTTPLPAKIDRLISGTDSLIMPLSQEEQARFRKETVRINDIYRKHRTVDAFYEAELQTRLLYILFELLRWAENKPAVTAESTAAGHKNSVLAERMIRFIAGRVYKEFNLALLQQEFHFSLDHLTHYFKENTGVSPVRFWRICRIKEAKRLLLHTSLPVKEIAARLNFGTSQYFSQTFKQWVGLSPREFRRTVRQI